MKTYPRVIDRILKAIQEAESICVVGHIRPDGDCVGSQLGLTYALKAQGKKVACWNQDPMPQKYRFLDREGVFQKPRRGMKFDCVIATDCASFERLGSAGPFLARRKPLINIDHHESNTRYGDINWVSPREPSTGELIYRLIKVARWPVTPRIADCLFTAISTDTGSFQYPTTRPGTFHAGGELVTHGADLATISNEVYQSYPLSRVQLLRHVYSRFKLTDQNRIAWFWLRKADLTRAGATSSDTEGLIDHIRAIAPVIVAVVFEDMGNHCTRISLRSKHPKVNVGKIAAIFGGGGHPAAAGARLQGNPASIQRRVLAAIRDAIHAAEPLDR